MPPDLDPRIILAQRQLPSLADMQDEQQKRQIQQQEVELRRQEIMARRDAIVQQAMLRGQKAQPQPYDPKQAQEQLEFQQKQGQAVYQSLVQAKAHPEAWGQIRANIGKLAGPDAVADLPESWDDQTAAIVDTHIASYPQAVAQTRATAPQLLEVPDPDNPGQTIRKVVTLKEGDTYPSVPKPAASERAQTETSLAVAAAAGDPQAIAALKIMKAQRASAGGGAGAAPLAATGGLDPDGLELAGAKYRITGQTLSRDHTQNAAIANEAAKQGKLLGNSPVQTIQRQAAYSGDAKALAKMQAMSASAESFENKANAQTSIIRDLSKKVPRTSMPLINSALQAGRTEITGDANATQLANAIETFSEEYAKIMNGATGSSAAASDSSRAAAKRLINTAMSAGTMDKVLDLMQREMNLTMQGYAGTIDHITTRMGGSPPAPAAAPANAPASAGGRDRVVGPNGESGTVPAGTALPPGWRLR